MRCFGRHCRGQGHVLLQGGRHTERQLLALGQPITALGQQVQQLVPSAHALPDTQRERVTRELHTAIGTYERLRQQSRRLTQGKKLRHWKLVNAYDLTIAPILQGKSNCPAQFGRQPGIVSEPATGFIFADVVPPGNPRDPSDVLPVIDKGQNAIERVRTGPKRQRHSVAGDLGINDAVVRPTLQARGILTVGIPQTIQPIAAHPSAQEILTMLKEAGVNRIRTPYQVQLACASGYSRPVVESHIASLRARGAGHVRSKGLEGAILQPGMTIMAPNGAVIVRIRRQQVSKRAQKFRRFLGLRSSHGNEIKHLKN